MFSISNPSLVHEAASTIAYIACRLNPIEIVTPKNLNKEKGSWILKAKEGRFCNPTFIYDTDLLSHIVGLKNQLMQTNEQLMQNIKPQSPIDSAVHEIIKSRIRDTITSINMALGILTENDYETTINATAKYGQLNRDQKSRANIISTCGRYVFGDFTSCFPEEQIARLKEITFDANAIHKQFQNALDYYIIEGWKIEIDASASSIDIRNKTADGAPRIVIPAHQEVDGLKLIELIGHEIECHLRDSENAAQLFRDLLENDSPLAPLIPVLAKSDNEVLYEGHAKLSDVTIAGAESLPRPFYTIAQIDAAEGYSFSHVAHHIYELQLDFFGKENVNIKGEDAEDVAINSAWAATCSVFRGCTNTKSHCPYVFGKDYAYLAGFDIACKTKHPEWLNFASLSLTDLRRLHDAGARLNEPKYSAKNVAIMIANQLTG